MDTLVRPDLDGPSFRLQQGVTFGSVQEIELSALGPVTTLTGTLPAQIQVTDGIDTRAIRVAGSGQIQIQ